MTTKQTERIQELLKSLHLSCQNAIDGDWETTTDEGREGFKDMQECIEEVEEILNINQKN